MPKPPSKKVLRDLHYRMLRIRIFEEKAGRLAEDGKIPGALHLYVGQEAVAAGFMVHLSAADQITSTHRGHGHWSPRAATSRRCTLSSTAARPAIAGGKGGSMHIADMDLGMLGANGIVGAGPPIAAGAAFSNQFLKNGNVAVTFFGDGASNEGSFHEAANLAAVYKLASDSGVREQRLRRIHAPGSAIGGEGYCGPGGWLRHAGCDRRWHGRRRGVRDRGCGCRTCASGRRAHAGRGQDVSVLRPRRAEGHGAELPDGRRSRRVEEARSDSAPRGSAHRARCPHARSDLGDLRQDRSGSRRSDSIRDRQSAPRTRAVAPGRVLRSGAGS